MMKGVTLLGVEHLQHFSICDVSLVSNNGKVSFETKAQECVLEEEDTDDEREEKKEEKVVEKQQGQIKVYHYFMKLKFHSQIFGTFKQTVVFDFGERPLLSKVTFILKIC